MTASYDTKQELNSSVHTTHYTFAEYIRAALRYAKYETLEDGTYMATVEDLQGVIAVVDTIEDCRDDLIGAIEGWVTLSLQPGHAIPSIALKNNVWYDDF